MGQAQHDRGRRATAFFCPPPQIHPFPPSALPDRPAHHTPPAQCILVSTAFSSPPAAPTVSPRTSPRTAGNGDLATKNSHTYGKLLAAEKA